MSTQHVSLFDTMETWIPKMMRISTRNMWHFFFFGGGVYHLFFRISGGIVPPTADFLENLSTRRGGGGFSSKTRGGLLAEVLRLTQGNPWQI